VLAALAIFPDAILQMLFGGSFSGAAPVLLPLVVGQLAHVLFGNPGYVLSMTGHHRTVLWINLVAVAVLVAGGVIGARVAGPVGLAVGSAACLTVQNGLLWWFARRRLGIWTHVEWHPWNKPSATARDLERSPSEGAEINRSFVPTPSAGTRPSVGKRNGAILRRLWWLHPAWPFAGVVGTTILAAWFQDKNAFAIYGTPKYVEFEHVAMAFAAIAAFIVGCGLGQSTGRPPRATPHTANDSIRFWFYLTTSLTLLGYFVWFAVGVKNGFRLHMFVDLVTGADAHNYHVIRHELFPTIPGVTTCTQFGIAAMLFGSWLLVHGQRRVVWPLAVLMALAAVRCLLFSERTALIELLFPPAMVGLRAWILGRSQRPVIRWLLVAAPVICIFGVVLFFGVFEYFRSWMWYRDQFHSYAEFTMWRLSGYFTTAHNNGAMALVTDQPRPLPYFTMRPLWEFPGVSDSPLGYEALTGVDVPLAHENMLHRYGTYELNNEGGLFQPALDFGWAGFLVYWFGYGFISAKAYRCFLAGTFAGVMLYPLIYMSLLEVPLILFLMYTRVFPSLVAIGIAAWMASRATSPRRIAGRSAGVAEKNNGVLQAPLRCP
jgi:hypothetical protein